MRARHASIESRHGGHGRAAAGGGMAGLGVDDSAGLTETGHREYGLRLVSAWGNVMYKLMCAGALRLPRSEVCGSADVCDSCEK